MRAETRVVSGGAAGETADAVGGDRGAGGVGPARAVHAAAGMGRRRRQEQAAYGGLRPTETRHRPEHELLGERGRAATERATHQVGVERLERRRREQVPRRDHRSEPRRVLLDLGLDAVGERLGLAGVPRAPQVPARVAPRTQRHVGVGPHRLGAGRRAGGVGLVHLPGEHVRVRGDAVLGEVGGVGRDAVHAVAEVDGPRAHGRFVPPRDRSRQRPVDLERRVVVLEPGEVVEHVGRQVFLADEVAVERGCADVGEHPSRCADRLAVVEHDGHRPPVAHLDAPHRRVAPHHPTPCDKSPHERGGELARAALGDGEPVLLAEAGEQPAEEAARRDVGAEVAVHRVAGDEQGGAVAVELLLGETAHREQRLPGELEQAPGSERGGQPGRPAQRRDGRRHRVDQRTAQSLELGGERTPTVAVAGSELLDRRRGDFDVGGQRRAPAVRGRVREHERGVPPAQPVGLEVERAHDR